MNSFKPPPPKQSLSSKNRERRQLHIKNRNNDIPVRSELNGISFSPIQPSTGSKIENKMWHSINKKTSAFLNNNEISKMQVKLKEDDSSNRNCSSVNDSTQIDIKNITDKISSTIEIKMWRSLNQNIGPVFTAPNQNRFFSKEESIEDNKSPPDRIVSTFTNTTVPNIHQNAQNADMVMPNVGGKDFIRFHTTHPISGDGTTANSIITTPSRGAVVSRRRLLGREEVQQASPSKAVSTASRKPTKNRQSVVVHIEQPKRTSIDTPPVLSSHGDRRRVQTPLKSRNRNNFNDRQKAVVETDTEITTKFAIKYVADLFSLSR